MGRCTPRPLQPQRTNPNEVRWAPQPVWTICREWSLDPDGIRTSYRPERVSVYNGLNWLRTEGVLFRASNYKHCIKLQSVQECDGQRHALLQLDLMTAQANENSCLWYPHYKIYNTLQSEEYNEAFFHNHSVMTSQSLVKWWDRSNIHIRQLFLWLLWFHSRPFNYRGFATIEHLQKKK